MASPKSLLEINQLRMCQDVSRCVKANIVYYNSFLKAFGSNWEAAMALLDDLPARRVEADCVSVNTCPHCLMCLMCLRLHVSQCHIVSHRVT